MEPLEKSVFATVAYYSAGLGVPVTASQIHQRLIPSAPLAKPVMCPSLGDVVAALDRLRARGLLGCHSGFYTISTEPSAVDAYVEREKITAQKWREMLRFARWLQVVPFVSALFASGSLALNAAREGSDWDVFVIARAGRLYTARLFLLATAAIMGRLRTKNHAVSADRFCFNHFITTDGLKLRSRGLYVAHTIALLVPIADPRGYAGRLRDANRWMGDFIVGHGESEYIRRSVKPSLMRTAIRRFGEGALGSPLGTMLEWIARQWQQRRILSDPATHRAGARILADDKELELHPRPFEPIALARFTAACSHRVPELAVPLQGRR